MDVIIYYCYLFVIIELERLFKEIKMATTKEKNQDSQEKVKDAYHLAEEATSEAVSSLKDHAKESLNEGSAKVKSATHQAGNMIKEHPLLSVGCAFLAGWAISKITK